VCVCVCVCVCVYLVSIFTLVYRWHFSRHFQFPSRLFNLFSERFFSFRLCLIKLRSIRAAIE